MTPCRSCPFEFEKGKGEWGFEPGYLRDMIRDGIHSATQDTNLHIITSSGYQYFKDASKLNASWRCDGENKPPTSYNQLAEFHKIMINFIISAFFIFEKIISVFICFQQLLPLSHEPCCFVSTTTRNC